MTGYLEERTGMKNLTNKCIDNIIIHLRCLNSILFVGTDWKMIATFSNQ